MSFYSTYELIDLQRDDGIKTFSAREIATGRTVLVHLFTRPQSPEMQALLGMLAKLSDSAQAQILTQGDHEGTPYVVTIPITAYPSFRDWLVNERRAQPAPVPPPAPAAPKSPDDPFASLFKKPATPATDPPPTHAATEDFRHLIETPTTKKPVMRPAPPPPESTPEGTRIMSTADFERAFEAQQKQPAAESKPVEPRPVGSKPSDAPGEFTRMFQAPAIPVQAPPPRDEPGEFTRMFQAPAVPVTPAPSQEDPGEFTRMFQTLPSEVKPAPVPPAPVQPAPVMEMPKASPSPDAGEFTRMFQTQPSRVMETPKPSAPPQQSDAGEFTRMFQAGGASPTPPPPPPAPKPAAAPQPDVGEFTRMFNSPPPPAAPQQPAGPLPAFPTPAATPRGEQPGEFTRMFESPLRPAPLPPTQGAADPYAGRSSTAASGGRSARRVHTHVRPERHAGAATVRASAADHAAAALGWSCRRDERVSSAAVSARAATELRFRALGRILYQHDVGAVGRCFGAGRCYSAASAAKRF